MATLVLTAVGGTVAGPVGAAVGAMVGSAIDHELLFKPKRREGPRLAELRVQTSSYGTQIPKIFGTMRVAGSVIWATDLVEHRSRDGGKGQPTTTSYSYTASFAVALSARPILGVGRIWADGTLLRGAAGDFKARTGFRLYLGDEAQMPDPLIAAAEGIGLAPAHRGLAYAVFEDLELADFGNRIPSLSFEVIADAAEVSAGGVVEALAGGDILAADEGPALTGFAAQGTSVRAAAETLAGAAGAWFRDEGGRLALLAGSGAATPVEDERIASQAQARQERAIAAAESVPLSIVLSHYDPERDHQAGLQRAVRPGPGLREERIELPAAIDAGGAKAIAEATLAKLERERERRTVTLPWRGITVRPGERVAIAGAPGVWRVERWSLEHMAVALDCVPIASAPMAAPASPGRVLGAPDRKWGTTILHAFELPALGDAPSATPRIAVAAAGSEPGWRSAALLLSNDGGASWSEAGGTAAPAVLGTLVVPPGPAGATLVDRRSVIGVELAHAGMLLTDADDVALAGGANLAMVGDELVQFARAEPIGDNRWRLSELWRGRRGTELAAGAQAPGDRFVLLHKDSLAILDLPAAALGGTVRLLGQGVGDATAAEAEVAITGISVLPLAPAQLRLVDRGEVHWARRSRSGWDWIDGVDAPIGEETERYRITVTTPDGERVEEIAEPRIAVTAVERASGATVQVRQIGARGLSAAATLILPPVGENR
ncbi:MAG: phage tail protein [Sphingomonas sp.]|uniref:phage tail protein n=1 Tax=Sphingomonas sp. TaxID=28214 RepID=UPI001B155AD2|nr:phage tail protein [Sphingomonas sp.]MBO9622140.1 phage tail protein [Sphingomonas sp.]